VDADSAVCVSSNSADRSTKRIEKEKGKKVRHAFAFSLSNLWRTRKGEKASKAYADHVIQSTPPVLSKGKGREEDAGAHRQMGLEFLCFPIP